MDNISSIKYNLAVVASILFEFSISLWKTKTLLDMTMIVVVNRASRKSKGNFVFFVAAQCVGNTRARTHPSWIGVSLIVYVEIAAVNAKTTMMVYLFAHTYTQARNAYRKDISNECREEEEWTKLVALSDAVWNMSHTHSHITYGFQVLDDDDDGGGDCLTKFY